MIYVLASANPGKIKEMREVLSGLGIDIVTRDELGITIDVEETGTTLIENATLKAEAICQVANMPAVADDSGLFVDALPCELGVYTSSYGGEGLKSAERCEYLLQRMKGVEQRNAKFVCTIVCAYPDGELITAIGVCKGTIAAQPSGNNGFGFDPVFIPEGETRTMAEMAQDEKNVISHRGKALREFVYKLGVRSAGWHFRGGI